MKIAYFFNKLEIVGGIPRIISEKINSLCDNEDNEIYLIYDGFENEFKSYYKLSKRLKIIYLNLDRNSYLYSKEYEDKTQLVLQSLKVDICISIVFSEDFYFLPKIKDGSKKIAEYHTCFDVIRGFTNFKFNWRLALKERIFLYKHILKIRQYDRIVVLSDTDAKQWRRYLNNVEVIPNFIDYSRYYDTVSTRKKQAVAVGRLDGVKAFDLLIEAWKYVYKKYPNFKLKIYGEGPLKSFLEEKVKSLHIDNVIKIFPPTKEIHEIYAESEFLICSSAYEGLPMVVLESMANGLPAVCAPQRGGGKFIGNQ